MKKTFFPTDGAGSPKFGTIYNFPEKYATAEAASADGCPVVMLLHGIGKPCQGTGTKKELEALWNWAGWKNGLWVVNTDKPGAVDTQNIIVAMVQTNSGYTKGEIQFLLDKVKKELKPKKRPTLAGVSWGGFGIINNVDNGSLDPREFSALWLMSPGGNGNIGKNFATRMKDTGVIVYLTHNKQDGIAKVAQSNLIFDLLSSIGHPVGYVQFQNPWTNDSHGSWANVFPSCFWRMYISIPPAADTPDVRKASNFAEIFEIGGVDVTYNWYEMIKRDLKDAGVVPPVPAPVLIDEFNIGVHVEIFKNADGSIVHKVTPQ